VDSHSGVKDERRTATVIGHGRSMSLQLARRLSLAAVLFSTCSCAVTETTESGILKLSDLNPCEAFVAAREFVARRKINVSGLQPVSLEYSGDTDLWLVIYRDPNDPATGAGHFGVSVTDRRPIRVELVPGI
jgi:hypothetical protein